MSDPITTDRFRVDRCTRCKVAFTAPRPPALDRYYPSRYRRYGPLVTRVLEAFYRLRVRRWVRLKPEGGSILELGCGPGLMLSAFRRCGWRVLGLERNEEIAAMGREHGLDIATVAVEALTLVDQFDLIILFQVLEHLGDPVFTLRECVRRLAPGGHLIVNVPNFASWQSRFGGPVWLHLDPPRHLVHFTPETLAATLGRAGLDLVDLRFASIEHDPYGWVESTISRLTGRYNTMTRALMGLDPIDLKVLLSFGLGVLIFPLAVALAIASWTAKQGALMEGIAKRSVETAEAPSNETPTDSFSQRFSTG